MKPFLWTAAADVSVLLMVCLAAASWLPSVRAWTNDRVSPSSCTIRRATSHCVDLPAALLKPIASTVDNWTPPIASTVDHWTPPIASTVDHWTPPKVWSAAIIALSTSMFFLSVSTVSVAVMDDSSSTALLEQSAFGRAAKEDSAVLKLRNGLISGAATRAAKELVLHPIETIK